ncbi:MAG: ABC transporter substrate-binding protein [SAR324 cluster bacterium]|nr:ABC transporter substrate-binding protein [SAR324 cluster bacterium]
MAAKFSAISKSTEIYFRFVNEQGGVHGRSIKYHYADDGFQAIRTQEVIRELVLRKPVFLILNGLGTATHASVSAWLQSLKVPDFFVGSSDPQWTEPVKETVFGFQPTPRVEGRALAKYLLQSHPGEQVVVWHRDDPQMKEASEHLSTLLTANHTPTHTMTHPMLPFDLDAHLDQIRQLNPKAIVLFTSSLPAIQFLESVQKHGPQSNIYLGHDLADSRLLEWVGVEAMEGVSVLSSFPLASQADHPGIQFHRSLLREYDPELTINRWTIYGQAVAELMVEILYRSGRNLTRQSVIGTAEDLDQWNGVLSPPITLSAQNHQAITKLRITRVQSGKFETISDWIDSK